jgi:hypothetical protein
MGNAAVIEAMCCFFPDFLIEKFRAVFTILANFKKHIFNLLIWFVYVVCGTAI